MEASGDDEQYCEYVDESDTWFVIDGWYESVDNLDDIGYIRINEGLVFAWADLPDFPGNLGFVNVSEYIRASNA
jgi:hypothetical protein